MAIFNSFYKRVLFLASPLVEKKGLKASPITVTATQFHNARMASRARGWQTSGLAGLGAGRPLFAVQANNEGELKTKQGTQTSKIAQKASLCFHFSDDWRENYNGEKSSQL